MNGQRLFGALTAGVALALLAVADRPVQAQGDFQVDSFFDVFVDLTTSNPNDPPIQVGVLNTQPGGETIQTEIVSMSLTGPPNVPVRMQARGGGGGGGNFAVDSFFDVFFDVTDPYDPATDSFFDVFVDLTLPDGTPVPGQVTAVNDWAVDSFFDITYEIDFADGGHQTLHLRGDPVPVGFEKVEYLKYELKNVMVTSFAPGLADGSAAVRGDSFFDVFVDLNATQVELPPPIPPTEARAMTLTLTGVYTPEPSSIVLAAVGLVGLIGYARQRKRKA